MTLTPSIIEDEAIAPNVGKEASAMFMGYYVLSRKIDLDTMKLVYSDPMTAPLPPKAQGRNDYEIDSAYILASAIAYEYRNRELTDQEIDNLFEYIIRVGDPTVAIQILSAVREIQPNVANNRYPATVAGLKKFLAAYPGSTREIEAANLNP
jgi:isopenicillin N synthase-like dioxygenase